MTTNTYTPVCLDIIDTLNGTTATILEFAFVLATDKKYLSRSDFRGIIISVIEYLAINGRQYSEPNTGIEEIIKEFGEIGESRLLEWLESLWVSRGRWNII